LSSGDKRAITSRTLLSHKRSVINSGPVLENQFNTMHIKFITETNDNKNNKFSVETQKSTFSRNIFVFGTSGDGKAS
jgi:hypothetical protein